MRAFLGCGAVLALAGIVAWAQTPAPAIAGVYSEGADLPGPIAPGMLAFVAGSNLASSTGLCNATTPLPSCATASRCW